MPITILKTLDPATLSLANYVKALQIALRQLKAVPELLHFVEKFVFSDGKVGPLLLFGTVNPAVLKLKKYVKGRVCLPNPGRIEIEVKNPKATTKILNVFLKKQPTLKVFEVVPKARSAAGEPDEAEEAPAPVVQRGAMARMFGGGANSDDYERRAQAVRGTMKQIAAALAAFRKDEADAADLPRFAATFERLQEEVNAAEAKAGKPKEAYKLLDSVKAEARSLFVAMDASRKRIEAEATSGISSAPAAAASRSSTVARIFTGVTDGDYVRRHEKAGAAILDIEAALEDARLARIDDLKLTELTSELHKIQTGMHEAERNSLRGQPKVAYKLLEAVKGAAGKLHKDVLAALDKATDLELRDAASATDEPEDAAFAADVVSLVLFEHPNIVRALDNAKVAAAVLGVEFVPMKVVLREPKTMQAFSRLSPAARAVEAAHMVETVNATGIKQELSKTVGAMASANSAPNEVEQVKNRKALMAVVATLEKNALVRVAAGRGDRKVVSDRAKTYTDMMRRKAATGVASVVLGTASATIGVLSAPFTLGAGTILGIAACSKTLILLADQLATMATDVETTTKMLGKALEALSTRYAETGRAFAIELSTGIVQKVIGAPMFIAGIMGGEALANLGNCRDMLGHVQGKTDELQVKARELAEEAVEGLNLMRKLQKELGVWVKANDVKLLTSANQNALRRFVLGLRQSQGSLDDMLKHASAAAERILPMRAEYQKAEQLIEKLNSPELKLAANIANAVGIVADLAVVGASMGLNAVDPSWLTTTPIDIAQAVNDTFATLKGAQESFT